MTGLGRDDFMSLQIFGRKTIVVAIGISSVAWNRYTCPPLFFLLGRDCWTAQDCRCSDAAGHSRFSRNHSHEPSGDIQPMSSFFAANRGERSPRVSPPRERRDKKSSKGLTVWENPLNI